MIESVYFHIGYPKAASSTLQKHLFDKHSEINFLGILPRKNVGQDSPDLNQESAFLKDRDLQTFHRQMVFLDEIEFYHKSEGVIEKVKMVQQNGNGVTLFSNERFLSVFYSLKDRGSKLRRIKEIFPEAKLLIVIRNQLDLIYSQYKDHPFDPRSFELGAPLKIDKWIEQCFAYDEEIKFFSSMKYNDLLEYASHFFGKENIKVLLFEDLKGDVKEFAKQISEFLNIDYAESMRHLDGERENRAVSDGFNSLRKLKRRLFGPDVVLTKYLSERQRTRLLSFLKRGKSQPVSISNENIEKLKTFFSEGNASLNREWDLNLEKHNYWLEK